MVHSPDGSLERAMLLEICQILLCEEMGYDAASHKIDDITRRFVLAAEPEERAGLQRSAALMAFRAATDKGAPFEAVAERFHARCTLGFEDVVSELPVLLEFVSACWEFGERNAGLRVLEEARERLEGSGMSPDSKFVRQFSEWIELCHQRLQSGE